MQRWFYANEELICEYLEPAETIPLEVIEDYPKRRWRFCVQINDRELLPNEALALSGNCPELGDWQFEKCVLMSPVVEGLAGKWHVYIDIPADRAVSYRYIIVALDPDSDQMIVRFFESHLNPRKVHKLAETVVDICEDVFGEVKSARKVERGWLTTERIVQLMFFKAPFKWCDATLKGRVMHVKVTPLYRRESETCQQAEEYAAKPLNVVLESKLDEGDVNDLTVKATKVKPKSKVLQKCGKTIPSYTKLKLKESPKKIPDTQKPIPESPAAVTCDGDKPSVKEAIKTLSTAFAFNEVVNFNVRKDTLKQQPTFGTPCGEKDLTLFHLTIGDFDNTVYLVELFMYSKNAAPDEGANLVGYRYLLPSDFGSASAGYIEAPIISASTHRRLGKMCLRFLMIRPAENLKFDLSKSYLRHWDAKQAAIDIGHRGQGVTYQTADGKFVFENTINSIQMAIDNGADMVEFDVHLSKDAVPVVYHDFNVHVSQVNPQLLQRFDSIALPLNKLTYKELRNLRMPKHMAPSSPSDGAAQDQQLFPRLLDVLDAVDEDVAYVIEIKWPRQYCNGKWQENVRPRFDPNLYIDRILEDIIAGVGRRRLVLISFEADLCSMLRFKQNRFPVMFLLGLGKTMPYIDARSNFLPAAINFAYGMELLGLIPHAQIVMRNPHMIGECNDLDLTIICYGVIGNENISVLKSLGVRGVILDRVDELAKQDECNCTCPPLESLNNAEENSLKTSSESVSFKSLESWSERFSY